MSGPIAAIVQARMGSQRLPGKVLRDLAGRPLLEWLIERLRRCAGLDGVVVATSDDVSDDPIARFCEVRGVPLARGPLLDVATRLARAAEAHGLDAFVRVCADSPLLDGALLEHAVGRFRQEPCDIVTNVHPRTFPRGQSVEVIDRRALQRALAAMDDPAHREHVTRWFYRNPSACRIVNLRAPLDWSGASLAVDTPRDLERLAALLNAMEEPRWQYGLQSILALHERIMPGVLFGPCGPPSSASASASTTCARTHGTLAAAWL